MAPLPLMAAWRAPRSAERLENLADRGASEIAAAVRSLPRSARTPASSARSRHGRGAGRAAENAPRRAAKTSRVGSASPGLTSRTAHVGQRRRPGQAFADAGDEGGAAGKAHRHVGAQARREIEQLLFGHRHPPEVDELTQRRGGIGRSAAQARRHGYMLDEADRGARRHACPVGQQARRLQHQIVGLSRQRRRASGPSTIERQAIGMAAPRPGRPGR